MVGSATDLVQVLVGLRLKIQVAAIEVFAVVCIRPPRSWSRSSMGSDQTIASPRMMTLTRPPGRGWTEVSGVSGVKAPKAKTSTSSGPSYSKSRSTAWRVNGPDW